MREINQEASSYRSTTPSLREEYVRITKSVSRLVSTVAICFLLLSLTSAPGWAIYVDEPPGGNNTCATAQNVGAIPFPDSFSSYLEVNDIDFYKFTGIPGQTYLIQVNT